MLETNFILGIEEPPRTSVEWSNMIRANFINKCLTTVPGMGLCIDTMASEKEIGKQTHECIVIPQKWYLDLGLGIRSWKKGKIRHRKDYRERKKIHTSLIDYKWEDKKENSIQYGGVTCQNKTLLSHPNHWEIRYKLNPYLKVRVVKESECEIFKKESGWMLMLALGSSLWAGTELLIHGIKTGRAALEVKQVRENLNPSDPRNLAIIPAPWQTENIYLWKIRKLVLCHTCVVGIKATQMV